MAQKQRDQAAEGGQEQLVESYLRDHPGSTIPQIRDGIEAESGIRIERVQARIDAIGRRIELIRGTGEYGRTSYSLGRRRQVVKAGGMEISLVAIEGQGVELRARQHGTDLDSPELQEMIGRILAAARKAMEARAVPLAEAAARAEGLLDQEVEEEVEDDWLSVLPACHDDEEG